jgi:hypothetical protein
MLLHAGQRVVAGQRRVAGRRAAGAGDTMLLLAGQRVVAGSVALPVAAPPAPPT